MSIFSAQSPVAQGGNLNTNLTTGSNHIAYKNNWKTPLHMFTGYLSDSFRSMYTCTDIGVMKDPLIWLGDKVNPALSCLCCSADFCSRGVCWCVMLTGRWQRLQLFTVTVWSSFSGCDCSLQLHWTRLWRFLLRARRLLALKTNSWRIWCNTFYIYPADTRLIDLLNGAWNLLHNSGFHSFQPTTQMRCCGFLSWPQNL